MPIRGVIFDLDGTLVDSGLDFDVMRREMGLPAGQPILEALAHLRGPQAERCRQILHEHEHAGARRATVLPGVRAFLNVLSDLGMAQAVVTRNCRSATLETLERLDLRFDPVVCREDAPVKPDPAAIHDICRSWNVPTGQVAVIGDFWFDIQAGRQAGAKTAFFTRGRCLQSSAAAVQPDFTFDSFLHTDALLAWLTKSA